MPVFLNQDSSVSSPRGTRATHRTRQRPRSKRWMPALLLVAAFALPNGVATGAPMVEFGQPVELALGPAAISEMFAAAPDDDSILLAYQTTEDTNRSIVASVVNALNGSVRSSTAVRPSPKGTLLTDAFANGQGQGGAVLIEGGIPFVELFYNGTFLAPVALPAGPQIASSCMGASGPFVVIACELVGLSPGSVAEVYAFRLTLDGALISGPTPVSRLDANFSGLASVAVDPSGGAWIAMRDQIPGELTLADVRVGVLETNAPVAWVSPALGRTAYEAPLPVIAVSRMASGSAYLAYEGVSASGGGHDLEVVRVDGVSRQVVARTSVKGSMAQPLKMTAVADLGPEGDVLVAWLDILPGEQPSTPDTVVRPVTAMFRGNLSRTAWPLESPLSMGASATFVKGEGTIVGWGLGARIYPIAYSGEVASDQGLAPATSAAVPSSVLPIVVSIGVAGLVPIALASDRASAGLALVFAPLLNHLRRTRSSADERRELIRAILAGSPGIHLQELKRRTRIGYGDLCHHLDYLKESGVVRSLPAGNKVKFYLSRDWNEHPPAPSDPGAALLRLVREKPGVSHAELSDSIGVLRTTLDYQARLLLAARAIVVRKEGKDRRYWVVDPELAPRPSPSGESGEIRPSGISVRLPPGVSPLVDGERRDTDERKRPTDPDLTTTNPGSIARGAKHTRNRG